MLNQDTSEMMDSYLEMQAQLERQCYVEDETLVLNVEYEYNIALDRIDSPSKILAWVNHLTEKPWMTSLLVKRFVELASNHAGIDLVLPG